MHGDDWSFPRYQKNVGGRRLAGNVISGKPSRPMGSDIVDIAPYNMRNNGRITDGLALEERVSKNTPPR